MTKENALDWRKWAEEHTLVVRVIPPQDNYVICKPEVLDLSRVKNMTGDVEFVQATRAELLAALFSDDDLVFLRQALRFMKHEAEHPTLEALMTEALSTLVSVRD